ncbi:MAG: NfeD family protein [Spirochaetia bacterium]|jgi:membrane protein implicated in regulation of membrane protease activity|nr:NfeD family protein [Spirochaetia bacterium]
MFLSPPFLWSLLGLLLITAEMFIPGFVIFFFGSGAIITGFLSVLIPGLSSNFALQGIIWILSSVFTFGFFRKKFTKIFRGTILNKEIETDLGCTVKVIEAITPEKPGRVRYQGTSWKAISYTESFEPGSMVDIIKEESLTFIVSSTIFEDNNKLPEEKGEKDG